jgi:HK97 family phage portal protein
VILTGYFANLLAAVRGKPAPDPRSQPNPFFVNFTAGTGRPQPKLVVNFTKLRAFSESPIPRRAIDYLKNQVSALEWDIVSTNGKALNGRQKKDADKVRNILKSPNNTESWRSFVEQTIEDMLVIGYTAIEKRPWPTNPDRPLVLYPIDASSLNLYTDWLGDPNKPRFAQIDRLGNVINFRDDQMMYIRYNPRTNTPWGLSPLEVAAQTVDYLLNTQAYASRVTSNATARKLLDLGEEIDDQQVKEIRRWWRDEVEGRGHMPIIGGTKGAKSIELGAKSDEELFLKWQQFLINQIANAFGMDAQKFGSVLATKSNGDVMDDSTDEGAVRPLASSLAAAINHGIIQALGFKDIEFKFRWTSNLRDRKSLAAIHQIYATQDIMTVDEIRAEIGLPPLPKGKGQYTLAEYRAIYGVTNTNSTTLPPGVVSDEEANGLHQTPAMQDEKPTNQNGADSTVPSVERR